MKKLPAPAFSILFALGLLLAFSGAEAKPKAKAAQAAKENLVLMPLRLGEADLPLQGAMETALLEGLQQKYQVFTGDKVDQRRREVFAKESKKGKTDCDETKCLQDIAAAFNSELLAVVSVAKQSDGYFLAINIRNLWDDKVVYSKSVPCKGCDAYAVVDKLKELVGSPASESAAPEPATTLTASPENDLWAEVQKADSADYYSAYLKDYPKGTYAVLAKTKLSKFKEAAAAEQAKEEKDAWDAANSSATEESYQSYLDTYPKGRFASLAAAGIKKLKKEAVQQAAQQARLEREAAAQQAAQARAEAANPKPGKIFKDCADCPEMVVVPGGGFTMGSPAAETGHDKDESPQHRVVVKAFSMGKTEVSVGEFRRFVQATRYQTDAEGNVGGASGCYAWDASDGKFDWRAGRYWDNPGFNQTDQQPAVCISWRDASAYVNWLAQKTGKKYRLPSEAEWEYAARGNTDSARYWGDNPNEACRYANVADTTKGPKDMAWGTKHECADGYWFTAPVASYVPNAFGLYDMIGNVWEWTADTYHDNYNDAPNDGSEWQGDGAKRVLRGGSWINKPADARSAERDWNEAAYRNSISGFRLARTLP